MMWPSTGRQIGRYGGQRTFYRYGYAVSHIPTKGVEEMLKLPRSTAGKWIAAAREAAYPPSEGMGKVGE